MACFGRKSMAWMLFPRQQRNGVHFCWDICKDLHWLATNIDHWDARSGIKKINEYRKVSSIRRTLIGNTFFITHMSVSALLQLHLHSQFNTRLQWIGQRQLRDETRNIFFLLAASYIRDNWLLLYGKVHERYTAAYINSNWLWKLYLDRMNSKIYIKQTLQFQSFQSMRWCICRQLVCFIGIDK